MPWDYVRSPITGGYQKINPTTATGLTLTGAETGARMALISVEAEPVRMRDDGTDPTASEGLLLPAGTVREYAGTLSALKFIDTAAGASTVTVLLYK